jgi:hypothetical protein
MEVSGQLHAPAALPPGKSSCYPLDGRLVGPHSRSGHDGEEKKCQPLPGFEPPIIQPVTHPCTTELSRLSYKTRSKIIVLNILILSLLMGGREIKILM